MSLESAKKAVIEAEVTVPTWSDTVLIQDGDNRVWLSQWLAKQFKARMVGSEIVYGKMRITVQQIE